MSRLVVSLLLVTGLAGSTLAQTPALAQQRPFSPSAYLERVVWTAQERGPLLVVAPNLSALPREGGVNVLDFATALQRKLVRNGSLSALVPEKMLVLNTKLGKPDRLTLPPTEAIVALAASLDERQWRQLGGEQGLGQGDLTPEQRPLFVAVLPPGLRATMPVPPEALAQGRLHISKHTNFVFAFHDEKLNATGAGSGSGSVTNTDTRPILTQDAQAREQQKINPFAVALTSQQPNRSKPSQLDYQSPSLNTLLSLENLATVGELLERIGKATGRELRADKRLAELPLWIRSAPGQRVRVGTLLETLALSVTGTFRKVEAPGQGQLWLLTDDIEGIASRLELQRRWQIEVKEHNKVRQEANRKRLANVDLARFIGYDNLYGFSAELVEKLLKQQPVGPLTLPLTAFPKRVADQLGVLARKNAGVQIMLDGIENPSIDPTRIKVWLDNTEFTLTVPGYGVYRDTGLGSALSNAMQKISPVRTSPLPRPKAGDHIMLLSPQTPEEAIQVITAAATSKLSAVWLTTDGDKQDVLKAALREGQKAGVSVGALLNVGQLPASAPADLDVVGEPGPWRIPDIKETTEDLMARLKAVAALPGLAMLILAETTAPGYVLPTTSELPPQPLGYGFTPERRIRFIRTEGYDPIDLTRQGGPTFLQIPNDETTLPPKLPLEPWSKLRYDAHQALMRRIYTGLKEAAPLLPVWVQGRDTSGFPIVWFGSWDKPTLLPTYARNIGLGVRTNKVQQARSFSQHIVYSEAYSETETAMPDVWLTNVLADQLRPNTPFPWDGFVMDLRTLTTEKALAVLRESKL